MRYLCGYPEVPESVVNVITEDTLNQPRFNSNYNSLKREFKNPDGQAWDIANRIAVGDFGFVYTANEFKLRIQQTFYNLSETAPTFKDRFEKDIRDKVAPIFQPNQSITFVFVRNYNTTQNYKEFLKEINFPGFEQVEENANVFFKRAENPNAFIKIFKHVEGKRIIVLTDTYYPELTFKALAFMPGIFPQVAALFSNEEKEYLKHVYAHTVEATVSNPASVTLLAKATQVVGTAKYKDMKATREVNKAIAEYRQARVAGYERTLINTQAEIENDERILASLYTKLKETRRLVTAINNEGDDNITEFFDYARARRGFLSMKKISTGVGNLSIVFYYKVPLMHFSEDEAQMVFKTPKSNIADVNKLLKEIFIDRVVTLNVLTSFYINFNGSGSYAKYTDHFDAQRQAYSCFRNPHLYHYSCWGSNATPISKALTNAQYESALEQIIASYQNINLADSGPVRHMKEDLESGVFDNVRCLIDMEGNEYTIKEWRKKQNEKEDNKHTTVQGTATIAVDPEL